MTEGYVYLGSGLLAVQSGGVRFVHEDPVTKSKRVTDTAGAVLSVVETDPWGADTTRSTNAALQPRRFTSYERDANGSDEAMFRRYNRAQARFEQPDPYDGSYVAADPQSLNRYSYVQNDPVNFVDPTGLMPNCHSTYAWDAEGGAGYNGSLVATGTICYGVPDDWYNGPREPNTPEPPDDPPTTPQDSSITDYCLITAMLDVIAFAEGADYGTVVRGKVIASPHNPDLVGQRNVSITDFSRHPQILVQVNSSVKSTAAGRYQFTYATWQDFGAGLPDFSPASQDHAALSLMNRLGMSASLRRQDFAGAVEAGKSRWDSFNHRAQEELKAVYEEAFNSCQDRLGG